jgi:dedicated sortase system histidine kinase
MPRLGLRTQLILVSLLVLAIPWAGYRFLRQMEHHLRESQLDTLLARAGAVASTLHERMDLFPAPSAKPGPDLYVHPLAEPIQLDGYAEDWRRYRALARDYGSAQEPPRYRLLLGSRSDALYLLLDVDGGVPRYCAPEAEECDRIRLVLGAPPAQSVVRLATAAPGWIRGETLTGTVPGARIRGEWQERSEGGYRLELRIPQELAGAGLGVAVTDARNRTTRTFTPPVPNGLTAPSPELTRVLQGLERSSGRLWVVDSRSQVLGVAGRLQESEPEPPAADGQIRERFSGLRQRLYRLLLEPPGSEPPEEDLAPVARLRGPAVSAALEGRPQARWQALPEPGRARLSAAYPIWSDERVAGAVVVEQTGANIASIRSRATAQLLDLTLAVYGLVTLVLLAYASLLSRRIRRLRDDTQRAITRDGRVVGTIAPGRGTDELSELRGSFAAVLNRLQGYTDYLETMGGKLSHELRTPLAVVQSSLDNLEHLTGQEDSAPYLRRAREGVTRLSRILNNLSEATRLEQSLAATERERFDLKALVEGCVEGYRTAFPDIRFALAARDEPLFMNGAPELLAQLLDKLVANAVDFHTPGTPIRIGLETASEGILLRVRNQGPALPSTPAASLFDSMVSMRPGREGHPHLGLGLYLVRLISEFHGGRASAHNLPDGSGVEFQIHLPTPRA